MTFKLMINMGEVEEKEEKRKVMVKRKENAVAVKENIDFKENFII